MPGCAICEGSLRESEERHCGVCSAVLPDITHTPGLSVIPSEGAVSRFREDLGNPSERLGDVWRAVRSLRESDDIAWLYQNAGHTEEDDWRWITSPPPSLEFDGPTMEFLADRTAPYRNDKPTVAIMRNLQRGGLLPSGEFLSWSGGRWYLDGKEIEVPHVLLSMLLERYRNFQGLNWGRLLRTIDLAVTQVVESRRATMGPPRHRTTLNPALYMLRLRRVIVRTYSAFKQGSRNRLTASPSDFGQAAWLRSWSRYEAEEPLSSLLESGGAVQQASLLIIKGRLSMMVRRPGGAVRRIMVQPHPDLVARIVSWFLSHPQSREFRRFECLRTRIFAGQGSSLVEDPERTALKLLRSIYDSTEGCKLARDGRAFRVLGTSGLVYDVSSCSKSQGAHGSRFKIRCLGPEGERHDRPPWRAQHQGNDICIRESSGPRLPVGDLLVQAILTVSQDMESASRGIHSIGANIAQWQGRLEQSMRQRRRRADPMGAAFQELERLNERIRGDWIHRRVRRAAFLFPALWSAMIRGPVGTVIRFTSLENAAREQGRPNVVFEGVTTRLRTESRLERQVVRAMLLGSGFTRQTEEERRTGEMQIWRRTMRADDEDLAVAVRGFCRLLENMLNVGGRRFPMAPEPLEHSFEADSEVYDTALLPASRGLIV